MRDATSLTVCLGFTSEQIWKAKDLTSHEPRLSIHEAEDEEKGWRKKTKRLTTTRASGRSAFNRRTAERHNSRVERIYTIMS